MTLIVQLFNIKNMNTGCIYGKEREREKSYYRKFDQKFLSFLVSTNRDFSTSHFFFILMQTAFSSFPMNLEKMY